MACEKARKSGKRTGQKRSRKDPPKQDRLLEELNRTRISMDGWMALLTAIENIPAEDRSFESLVIAAGEVFDDLDEALAAIIQKIAASASVYGVKGSAGVIHLTSAVPTGGTCRLCPTGKPRSQRL